MGFVLPQGTKQNMQTGLIPLTSVRVAVARSMPDRNNASLWTNPCYSGFGAGMLDSAQGYKALYASAASQVCRNSQQCLSSLLACFFSTDIFLAARYAPPTTTCA